MSVRYQGDVAIPGDQPLFGRCGLCGDRVVYGVTRNGRDDGGVILEPIYKVGGKYRPQLDGLFIQTSGGRATRLLRGLKGYDPHVCIVRQRMAA